MKIANRFKVTEKSNSDFSIDKLNLDSECVRQVQLVHYWTGRLARARGELDEAKAMLELELAMAAKRIRRLKEKVTVAEVSDNVTLDEGVKERKATVREKQAAVDLANACITTLDNRKNSLTLLVNLQQRDYFSSIPTKK